MDPNLETMKQDALTATNAVGDMQTSAPGMLQELRKNLFGIFAKDNPIVKERDTALASYLSAAAQSRADMLPGGMPIVEGRPLALSPTQQNAVTTGRNAAAFAPLVGWNEILRGQQGTIADMIANAGDIYNAEITAAGTRAGGLMEMYKIAVNDAIEREKIAAAERQAAGGSGGIDLAAIMDSIRQTMAAANSGPSLDDIFAMGGAPQQPNNQNMDTSTWFNKTPASIDMGGKGGGFTDKFGVNIPGVGGQGGGLGDYLGGLKVDLRDFFNNGGAPKGLSIAGGGKNPLSSLGVGGLTVNY